jgi:hypothetical protein
LIEGLAGTGDGIALGVDQALDVQYEFYVAAAIEALACSALVGLELGELGLPEAKDVGFEIADASYVTNLEIETVGDRGRVEGTLLGELRGHGVDEEETPEFGWKPASRLSIG